jgi:adenylate cyclase
MDTANQKPIRIDLDRFKLHLKLTDGCELSLHFNTPSRRFYLSVIALVLTEMKKRGRIVSISLEEHWEVLALLNETVGAGAGSSSKEHLLPRIYRKWKDALPDLEDAPLFRVLGKKKDYGEGVEKTYSFRDEEKDAWANLFEYKGSFENVRLRFSIDRLGATLDDVLITYGESTDLSEDGAWELFLDELRRTKEETAQEISPAGHTPDTEEISRRRGERKWLARWQFASLVMGVMFVLAGLALWNFHLRPDVEPASVEKMAFPLPDKPSLAVLPFVNMSKDPELEFLCDGITENIITTLCGIPEMFVIARTSTSIYKGKPVKIQRVSEELGVRYVLEGSVMKAGDRIRVTAQLNDAITGHHLWADRYDRDMSDFFALLDEITRKIAIELQVNLTEGDIARLSRKTENLQAWGCAVRANSLIKGVDRESIAKARQLAEKAVEWDPEYAFAWGVLGAAHSIDAMAGYTESPEKSFEMAVWCTDKSLELDQTISCAAAVKGKLYMLEGRFDQAMATGEKAIALGPSSDIPHILLSMTMLFAGRFQDAIGLAKKAMRLNPYYPAYYLNILGRSYLLAGQHKEALEAFQLLLEKSKKGQYPLILAHVGLCQVYSELGRMEDARAQAEAVLDINPRFSLEWFAKRYQFKDPAHSKLFVESLRRAGLT